MELYIREFMESAAELRRCDVVRVVAEAINSIQICVAVYIVRQSVHQLSIKSLNIPKQPIGILLVEVLFMVQNQILFTCGSSTARTRRLHS